MSTPHSHRGFTLIELLLVIAIIGILASIVIVAINPNKQLGDARNAQRFTDVNTILNAVYQYAIDHDGAVPAGIPTVYPKPICQTGVTGVACTTTVAGVDLSVLEGEYIVRMPVDPQLPVTNTGTRYTIIKDANNRITVNAYGAEQGKVVSATR